MDTIGGAIGNVLVNAVREAAKNSPVNPEDYEGLDEKGRRAIFCGVCHEPKRFTVELFDGRTNSVMPRLMPRACKCGRERLRLKKAEESAWNRDAMRSKGNISPECTFRKTESNPDVDKCWRYFQKWDEMKERNVGLLLWGGNGPGKSHAAHCIANALLERDPPVSVYAKTFAAILSGKFDKTEVLKQVFEASLVIFEDLGAERGSDYALETVFALVDERYRTRKPTIVTTNLTLEEIRNPLDEWKKPDRRRKRIYDRILEMCVPIEFHGESRRPGIGMDKLEFVRRTLEL